jgi:hypothetical protein
VICFTGHGNVNNWDCFSGGDVPGLAFDNVHLPLFVGFTCLSGSYAAGALRDRPHAPSASISKGKR